MLTWDQFMIPVLRILSDGELRRRRDIVEQAQDDEGITTEQRNEILSSGQSRPANRVNWAISYLSRAGAIESPQRALWKINDRGQRLLRQFPDGLTKKELFAAIKSNEADLWGTQPEDDEAPNSIDIEMETSTELDPYEQIEEGSERNHQAVAAELLEKLHHNDPEFFEQAVLKLLIAMGYGGTFGKALHTQLSNDGGIDGIIDQDALGLSRIYVQAKRYDPKQTIGRPAIQGFVGALQGAQATQGVFLTTASFTKGAREYAEGVQSRVVLIDGERLTRLMIHYGVGVQVKNTVQVVEIDEDFFE
ncbi:restriction endonuclease [Corynebacterium glucuronolyticum]|uniref:restriction endonuclease n=1 Tax=Corynebacterium TaxID=1716 RepID=UPI0030B8EAB1